MKGSLTGAGERWSLICVEAPACRYPKGFV